MRRELLDALLCLLVMDFSLFGWEAQCLLIVLECQSKDKFGLKVIFTSY